MVSLKLIKANRDNCKGILFAIVLCVTVFIASLLYIDYSMRDMDREIAEKYGKTDIVFYDTSGTGDWFGDLKNRNEVVNVAWQSNIPAYIGNYSIVLHILDFDAHHAVNDMKTTDHHIVGNDDGIFLGSSSLRLLGLNEDHLKDHVVELTVGDKTEKVQIAHVLDEQSYYEVAGAGKISAYMSEDCYTRLFGSEMTKNVFLVDLGNVSGAAASRFARMFEDLISHNIVDRIDLYKKQSSQSFIYAVSFILIGLVGIVFGGLYNFSRTIVSENIEHIGFLRTLGLSHRKATVLYQDMVLLLGIIGEAIGVVLGVLIGNLFIFAKYGFSEFVFPQPAVLLASLIVSIAAPYVFMTIQAGKYRKYKPIGLLLAYRNQGYDEKEDRISKYVINGSICVALFIILMMVRGRLKDDINMILTAAAIFAAVKAVENIVVVCLHLLSLLSNQFISTRPLLALSFRNLARNKKKVVGVLGTLILILTFHIGMYNVFFTIRTDAANKIELQYNGHAFITNYNQTQEALQKRIKTISQLPVVKSVETSHSRYFDLGGNRIEGYILSESEFDEFFNLLDVQTGKKISLPKSGQGAIIGEGLAKKGNILKGDRLTLSDESNTYEVIVEGICDAYEYMGNIVYLNEKFFKYPVNNITVIFHDGVDVDEGIEAIEASLAVDGVFAPTIRSREQIKENYRQNAIKGTMFIEVILVFISTIGVFMLINQVIQFINGRTREFALMRVMGTSFGDIMKFNFTEFILFAVVGIAGSIASGILVTRGFVDIASISAGIGKVLSYHNNLTVILTITLYVFILYSFSLFLILNKTRKKSMIMTIREE